MIYNVFKHYPAGDITGNLFNVRIFQGIVTGLVPPWACEFACTSKDLKELCHGVFIYFSDLTKLFSH